MLHHRPILIALLAVQLLAVQLRALPTQAEPVDGPADAPADSTELSVTAAHYHSLLSYPGLPTNLTFSLGWNDNRAGDFLRTYVERFHRPRRIELSRLDYALHGAGAGATMGLFAGAMGSTAGFWNDRTAWYLAGVTTTLGAILGGTTMVPDDERARVRMIWEP